MIRQDYILRLIEEAGAVIAKLLNLRKAKKFDQAQELIERCYSGFFQLETASLNQKNGQELLNWLLENRNLQEPQLKVLADLLVEEGEIFQLIRDTEKAHDRFKKAFLILEYLNQANPQIYSFERARKIVEIQQKIINLKT